MLCGNGVLSESILTGILSMKTRSLFAATLLGFLALATARADSGFHDFITARGDQLLKGKAVPVHFLECAEPAPDRGQA